MNFRKATLLSFKSVAWFLSAGNDSLRLRRDRIGTSYDIEESGHYTIFRETVSRLDDAHEQPVTLVFGFRLKVIGSNAFFHRIFQRVCIITTPFWSGFRGFRVKLWMVDQSRKNYCGVYEWLGQDNAQAYVDFLIPILRLFAVRNSLWHTLSPGTGVERYLGQHRVNTAESR